MSKQRTQFGEYTISANDTIESIGLHKKNVWFNKLWLYPGGRLSTGKLSVNSDAVYIGERGDGPDTTPDLLDTGDGPMKIEMPIGDQKRLEEVLIQGKAGDSVWYKYWLPLVTFLALLFSFSSQAQERSGGSTGLKQSGWTTSSDAATARTSLDVYSKAEVGAIGGPTNGISKLNGSGTNTTLLNATIDAVTALIKSGTNDAISSIVLKRYNLKDFGAVGDGQIANDSRIASGSTSLFCSTVAFTSDDVGKVFTLYRSNLVNHTTTIAAFVNSTNVTLTDAPTVGVTNFPGVYGTDDTVAIQRAVDFTATNGGGRIMVPKGIYIIAGALRDTSGDGITNHNAQIFAPNIAHIGQQCPIILFEGVAEQGGRVKQDFRFENYGSTFWSTLAAGPDGTNYGSVFDFRSPDSGSKPGILTPAFTVNFNNLGVATKNIHFRAAWDNGMALLNLGGAIMANLQDTTLDGGWDWVAANYYPAFMPTRTNTIGLILPQVFNDNRVYADNVVASCFYRGVCLGENLKSKYIASYYNDIGFDFYNAGGAPMELSYFHSAECKTNFYHRGGFTAQIKMYGFIQQQIITNFTAWYDPFGAITGEGFFILGNSSGTIAKFSPATFAGSPNFDATCLYSIAGTSTGPRRESVQRFGTNIIVEGNAFIGGELDITNSPGVYSMKLTRTANQAAVLAQIATDSSGGWNFRKEIKTGSAMYSDSYKEYWGGPLGTYTGREIGTNGVNAFPNGIQGGVDIANPAPVPLIFGAALKASSYKAPSGTDVLLWNSNKVIYSVSTTKTNLISDLR